MLRLSLLPLLLVGCEIEKVSIPRTEGRVALHSVLSATASTQVLLLERTRTGSVYVVGQPFDSADPIFTDTGISESNAFVRLITPDGRTLLGLEDYTVRSDGKGFGIYRFYVDGSALVRGGSYRLLVQTVAGENLSAETTLPAGAAAENIELRSFDRSRDTALLAWPAAAGARSYFVRVETPFGPRSFFTDSTRVRLTGDLRNVDADALRRVFIPGFAQTVTVSAVDSNYYDWYRSHNDAVSGAGLVNRVTGGLGVFGSLVRLHYEDFEVVAPQSEPVAGTFDFISPADQRETTPYSQFQLYVESPSARSDQADALSGRSQRRVSFGDTGCTVCGVLGTTRDGRVELALLNGWSATDTLERFTGEFRGDTLLGSYSGHGGNVRFLKRR
jgi:hypothetical protein